MAIEVILDSKQRQTYCLTMIQEAVLDGSKTVVVKDTDMSPTAKQRRLRWLWAGEIANSGLGQHDTKDGVDMFCKWKFGRPILLRDSEVFGAIFAGFEIMVKDYDPEEKKECYRQFTRDYISIENLMSRKQEAEYLTDIQNFWTRKGVCLTDPGLLGLDPTLFKKNKDNI